MPSARRGGWIPGVRSADNAAMNWLLLPSVLLLGSVALAQEPSPSTPRRDRATSQTEERAQSMRKQIGEGRAVQSHVKVLVRLKNGNRLVGVVKDGKLVERIDGLRFVEAAAGDDGAGIRIWYTAGTRNFVFVPFKDFANYEIVQQLSNEQVQQIEKELGMDRGKSDPATPAGAPNGAKPATPAGEPVAGEAKGADGKTTATDEQQKLWFDLLQAYPPTAGWGPERRDEIKNRFVVVGSQPSAAEKRFVDEYEQWSKACAYFGVTPAGKAKAATPADPREAEKADRRARRGETTPPPPPGSSGADQRKEERRARRGLGGSQGSGEASGGASQGGGGD